MDVQNGGSDSSFKMYGMNVSTGAGHTNDYGNGGNIKVKTDQTGEIRIRIASGYTANNLIFKPKIEKGTVATEYVEHKSQTYTIPTQQPMRAIGDVRDKFILKENGKWYERHNIARKIFDGTETFTKETRNEVTNFYMSLEGFGSQKGYCNILPVKIDSSYTANILFIWANLKGISMMFEKSRFSTVSDYQAYLAEQYNAGTPVYVDYVLETPLDLPCTEEQIQQLENKPSTYKEMTIINSEDETPAYLEVAGIYDLNNLINN